MSSGERPEPVRLHDLAAPTFPDHIAEILASVDPMAESLVFDPAALKDAASEATGLDDFGDDRFEEPLSILCTAMTHDVDLSPMGRVSQHSLFVQLLKNRLLVEHELARHPEIHDMAIDRPIVVAGLPRTGTTHLHNLMSADPHLRSLPYWEALEPVLADAERAAPGVDEPDPRLARTDAALWFINEAMPYFERMHEMTTHHTHEEIQLLALDFSTMLFEATMPLPRYRDWFDATDQTESYRYLRTVLQVLTHLRGGDRWVLKSPQHLAQFGPLMSAFPDATVVVTHRDPVAVTASMATMVAYSNRLNVSHPDPTAIGAYWADRVEHLLSACVRDRDLLPADQSIDVRFDEFMADDLGMVERIYALADQPWTPGVRGDLEAYLADHPRGRHGAVVYDLAQVGLDPDERRAALQFYRDRFGV